MAGSTYAKKTEVPVSRTVAQLKELVLGVGCTHVADVETPDGRAFMFQLGDRTVRYEIPKARWQNHQTTKSAQWRTQAQAIKAAEAEDRQRWREVWLYVKAITVAAQAGIVTYADAFLANTVLPDGQLVGKEIGELLQARGYATELPPVTTMPAIGS